MITSVSIGKENFGDTAVIQTPKQELDRGHRCCSDEGGSGERGEIRRSRRNVGAEGGRGELGVEGGTYHVSTGPRTIKKYVD